MDKKNIKIRPTAEILNSYVLPVAFFDSSERWNMQISTLGRFYDLACHGSYYTAFNISSL